MSDTVTQETVEAPKKRGRPKKSPSLIDGTEAPKKRGRPPKEKAEVEVKTETEVEKAEIEVKTETEVEKAEVEVKTETEVEKAEVEVKTETEVEKAEVEVKTETEVEKAEVEVKTETEVEKAEVEVKTETEATEDKKDFSEEKEEKMAEVNETVTTAEEKVETTTTPDYNVLLAQFNGTSNFVVSLVDGFVSQLEVAKHQGENKVETVLDGVFGDNVVANNAVKGFKFVGGKVAQGYTFGFAPAVAMGGAAKGLYKKVVNND
jgi:Fe2+ transport system protein B